jgi:hypothetical protein
MQWDGLSCPESELIYHRFGSKSTKHKRQIEALGSKHSPSYCNDQSRSRPTKLLAKFFLELLED